MLSDLCANSKIYTAKSKQDMDGGWREKEGRRRKSLAGAVKNILECTKIPILESLFCELYKQVPLVEYNKNIPKIYSIAYYNCHKLLKPQVYLLDFA